MKGLPTEEELRTAFSDFAKFTFDLIGRIEADRKYLKFAAVNAQVALELFLKYYFVKLGRTAEIQKKKGPELQPMFVEFSQVLNNFYCSRTWRHGAKREFVKLMETRNAIVHAGKKAKWDGELAKSIVRTLFFIHATAWSDLGEILLFDNYLPHPIAKNMIWREGAESFATDLSKLRDCQVRTCLRCGAYSVVEGEILVLDEGHSEDDLICLNCLTSVNISQEARLIKCYICSEDAYLIDALNEQGDQLYVGKCSECGTDSWVRRCANCRRFYHPSSSDEIEKRGKYFCTPDCAEIHADSNA